MPTPEQELSNLRGRIIELETQVKFLYKHLGITYEPPPPGMPAVSMADPRIVELIQKGKLMDATKLHRQLNSSDLLEAKAAVEEIKANLGL